MKCRHCKTPLQHTFVDLGFAPPSNSYLTDQQLFMPEAYYPLRVMICDNCWLVQTQDYAEATEFFSPDYAYFSSASSSWLEHAKNYCNMIQEKVALNKDSFVVEIASNDGYLLQNFVKMSVPCLGVEPADAVARAAEKVGVPVLKEFFSEKIAQSIIGSHSLADLIIGNNVFAHVPDINDFARGMKSLLKPEGVITLEFPHLLNLMQYNQFDTIYHEHFSYLSLLSVESIFQKVGLFIFDVEELSTHGGSLRIYATHDNAGKQQASRLLQLKKRELDYGLQQINTYLNFQQATDLIKNNMLSFLLKQKEAGKKVAAYGAAAKGNTMLNYCGVKPDLLPVVFDAAASKQDKYMPGSHIPIKRPEALLEEKPDFVLILPWNIADEIKQKHAYIADWGAKFVTAIPSLKIH